jgi:spermidine/putrescine transport system permease protein
MPRTAEPVARHGRLARRALGAYSLLSYVYLLAPIVLIVVFSFNENHSGTLPITGLTFKWYRSALGDDSIQSAFWTTLRVAAQVTVISTLVGTAAAFPLARSRLRFRAGIRVFFTLPIMIPGLLLGVGLLIMFGSLLQVPLSLNTVIIGQCVYTTPFVVLLVAAQIQGFDRDLERAASDLGANQWRRLRHVVLPLILPAIVAGMCFAFVLSVDEFIITLFTIGPSENTLPIYIYTQIRQGITPSVNAVVSVMLVGSIVILTLGMVLPGVLRRLLTREKGMAARRPAVDARQADDVPSAV